MSFQAYLDNIQAKTGKAPADFVTWAKQKGYFNKDTKAMTIVDALKAEFDLGQGHAMAIVQHLKNEGKDRV